MVIKNKNKKKKEEKRERKRKEDTRECSKLTRTLITETMSDVS